MQSVGSSILCVSCGVCHSNNQFIELLGKGKKDGQDKVSALSTNLALSAVECLCQLLMHLGHFNNVTDIITSIVRLCVASTPPQVLDRIGEALSATFSEDILLTVSLHAVKKIAEFVNTKRSYVWPGLISTLLSLNIRVSQGVIGFVDLCYDTFMEFRNRI